MSKLHLHIDEHCYGWIARLVLLIHQILVVFMFSGSIFVHLSTERFLFIYTLICLTVFLVTALNGGSCPLTELEQSLLKKSDKKTYDGSCLLHYVRQYLPCIQRWHLDIGKRVMLLSLIIAWLRVL